jgi:hypothetical protein
MKMHCKGDSLRGIARHMMGMRGEHLQLDYDIPNKQFFALLSARLGMEPEVGML